MKERRRKVVGAFYLLSDTHGFRNMKVDKKSAVLFVFPFFLFFLATK
jgi:hypothetical protein